MKVIDLLNKIANEEEIPKKIRVDNCILINEYRTLYKDLQGDYLLDYLCNDLSNLNDEIEIIEDTPKEDKKIEHINKVYDLTDFRKIYPIVAEMLKDLSKKQYEIIDKVNGE